MAPESTSLAIPHHRDNLKRQKTDALEFQTVPETGKLVFGAIGAKEEFCRFITALSRGYAHDESTIPEMLNFAYGITKWEFDPVHLQRYARGTETFEIRTSAFKVHSENGLLCGKREDIIQVRRCPATTTSPEFAGLLQLGDRASVRWMPVDIDYPWWRPTAGKSQA
jgi:hypothetical protein